MAPASDKEPALAASAEALFETLDGCLLVDRKRLRKRVKRLVRMLRAEGVEPETKQRRFTEVARAVADSRAVCEARRQAEMRMDWPQGLPITAERERLLKTIAEHQVVVVSGATGSGKSTQIPKLCLDAGRGIAGRIGHTQPRRIAARAVAARISSELGVSSAPLVAHCVRFDDRVAPETRVKLMTDGIVLHEIQHDPYLLQYDTLIVDEVHERTLNIDFLLGYLKRILPRRRDLKLVITSATLDVERFRAFFPAAALCEVAGRSYPIETRYRPLTRDEQPIDLGRGIRDAISELDRDQPGDILVFLPGEREIREMARFLSGRLHEDTEIVQLYGRMSTPRQARVFQPGAARRVILATNVAETSLTVPRVRHVIDAGLARINRYSPRRKLQQLPVEKIARTNADQRRGRCGREQAGVCIRLYSESDYLERRERTEPEIQRTHLAATMLRLKALGIEDVNSFDFMERPPDRLIKDACAVLQELGALDENNDMTDLGQALSRYPVDPRLARVLLAASHLGCLSEALIIVAALGIVDPRERPHEQRDNADRAHERFANRRSDFLWFLNAWPRVRELLRMPAAKRQRQCRRAFLSAARLQEWAELRAQLERIARSNGLRANVEAASYKQIHQALLCGFPTMVGEWQTDRYAGCRGTHFVLHPVSKLNGRNARWILAGDVVETARPFARLAARIEPAWLVKLLPHLIKRSYAAAHWDERLGRARVTEIQRIFGLVLEADRVVDLARTDKAAARAIFLEQGLVEHELGASPDFLDANRALLARVEQLEARARRRDLVAPAAERVAFYAARIPENILSRRDLLRWLRAKPERAQSLYMVERDATTAAIDDVPRYLFPLSMDVHGTQCELSYRFEPGEAEDGVCVKVPLVLLPRLAEKDFDRLVPGLLSEKIEQLLRALPKSDRRRVQPLRQFAMAALEAVSQTEGALTELLAIVLTRMTGAQFRASMFDETALPAHLRMRLEIIDERGVVIASGRNLEDLRTREGEAAREAGARVVWPCSGRSEGEWLFGDIPLSVEAVLGSNRLRGFPALCDFGDAVELAVYDTPEAASRMHAPGVARMLLLDTAREQRLALRKLPHGRDLTLLSALFGYRAEPWVYLIEACAREHVAQVASVHSATAFAQLRESFVYRLDSELSQGAARLHALFLRGRVLQGQLESPGASIPERTREDMRSQLRELLAPRIMNSLLRHGLARHERYLDAMARRIERADGNPGKDLKKLEQIAGLWHAFLSLGGDDEERENALIALHTMFEELRIHLFAPEIGTAMKISPAKVGGALKELGVTV